MAMSFRALGIGSLAAGVVLAEVVVPGDAARGAELFKSQHCMTCHSVNGDGPQLAADLGKAMPRSSTPFLIANLMWNHAPTMWAAMEKNGIQKPELSREQAADLFAFFWSARYFERPGDAARGREVFTAKRCDGCHALSAASPGGGPPVAAWQSLDDPIALAGDMWNHSALMRAAMSKKKVEWPQLNGQEMTDLLAYLQSLPEVKGRKSESAQASTATGEALFNEKGCASCHKGRASLENRVGYRTLTDFAAAMWNHAPQMRQPPAKLSAGEMRHLTGYLWSIQYFDPKGNAKAGKKVFEGKMCATCHNDPASGAPKLAGGNYSAFSMVAVLWRHGPAMLARMKQKNIPWPRFQGAELADLTAYLGELK